MILTFLTIAFSIGMADAKPKLASVCTGAEEIVVVKLPAPRKDALLVKCDKTPDLSQPEPRPFSRTELARIFSETRGESARDDHAEKWKAAYGITQESLKIKSSDKAIGEEILQFPQSDDLEAIRALAKQVSETQNLGTREVTIGKELSMQEFESGRLRLFASLCTQSGGRFSIPARFLEEFQLGVRSSLEGEAVCNCNETVFSNPIDYQCQASSAGQRLFRVKTVAVKPAASGKIGK